MSSAISGIGAGSFLSQLQNMQRQMDTLQQQATVKPPFLSVANTSDEVTLSSSVANTRAVNVPTAQDQIGSFESLLKEAFENVNNLQNESSNLQTRFDSGDRSVSLSDVMLATQKSSISFEAAIQVRNKLVEAYKTVSQMQI